MVLQITAVNYIGRPFTKKKLVGSHQYHDLHRWCVLCWNYYTSEKALYFVHSDLLASKPSLSKCLHQICSLNILMAKGERYSSSASVPRWFISCFQKQQYKIFKGFDFISTWDVAFFTWRMHREQIRLGTNFVKRLDFLNSCLK